MKRFILIESDTELYSFRAFEMKSVTPRDEAFMKVGGEDAEPLITEVSERDGKFFGEVRQCLVSLADLQKAKAVNLEMPAPKKVTA